MFVCLLGVATVHAADTPNRVEELFIWKVSDELKLSIPEEKSFTKLIKNLNAKKSSLNEAIQENIRHMGGAGSAKDKEKLLSEQKRLLKSYNELSIDEVTQIQKLFGPERAAQYFVLKNDLTNKLKTLLAAPSSNGVSAAPMMAPPHIIEEK